MNKFDYIYERLPKEEPLKKQITELREELGIKERGFPINVDALIRELNRLQEKFLKSLN